MISAISDNYWTHLNKVRNSIIILFFTEISTIYVLIKYVVNNMSERILLMIFLTVVFMVSFFVLIILSAHFVRIKRYSKIVGKNLYFDISESGIDILDVVHDLTIEKTFTWDDIEYIHMLCYTKFPTIDKYFYGLQFVVDEDKFHQTLSQRKRKPDYNQKNDELNYGFFIICDRDYFSVVEELWGHEIR